MFKKIILILSLMCMIIFPVFGQTGDYTTNEYFYLPEYGAYGTDEYDEYNTYMQIADTQIEANKTGIAAIDLSLYYLKTEIDTLTEWETIWSKNVLDTTELNTFSELQALVADKTLVNVEDGITATAITDDLILKADFANEDWGDISVSSNSVTIDEDVIDKANFKDEDWGDMSVSTNVVTLDAEVVDSEQYIDGSIDHEHLAPDVISGMTDVTSTDSDYILIWDATDSALKKCDMGEVRGTGGDTLPVVDTTGIAKGSVDATKIVRLEVDGLTTSTTRVITVPDANITLTSYTEGSWTPALKFGGASVDMTYGTQAGYYTKIGRQVTTTCYIILTNKGTSTGNATLTGLPFACKNAAGAETACAVRLYAVTFADMFQGFISKNTSTVTLAEVTNAGNYTTLTNADFANNSEMMITATYFTD